MYYLTMILSKQKWLLLYLLSFGDPYGWFLTSVFLIEVFPRHPSYTCTSITLGIIVFTLYLLKFKFIKAQFHAQSVLFFLGFPSNRSFVSCSWFSGLIVPLTPLCYFIRVSICSVPWRTFLLYPL